MQKKKGKIKPEKVRKKVDTKGKARKARAHVNGETDRLCQRCPGCLVWSLPVRCQHPTTITAPPALVCSLGLQEQLLPLGCQVSFALANGILVSMGLIE
jgi:hypothetical protein